MSHYGVIIKHFVSSKCEFKMKHAAPFRSVPLWRYGQKCHFFNKCATAFEPKMILGCCSFSGGSDDVDIGYPEHSDFMKQLINYLEFVGKKK